MRITASRHQNLLARQPISRRSFLAGGVLALAGLAAGCGIDNGTSRADVPLNLDLGYPNRDLLADPAWLAERIDNPNLRLLDCSPLPVYRDAHLPGALHIWWQDTIEVHNPVYGMLVNPDGRAKLVRQSGVAPDSEVVCYDDAGGVYAARILWTLRYMGFRTARLLVGDTEGWQAAGHELTRKEPEAAEGGIDDIFDESTVAHPQDILTRLDEPGLTILDTRTDEERRETWNNKLRTGKIPGSYWLPRDQFLQTHDVPVPLPSADLLHRLAASIPLDETAEVIVYGLHGTLAALPYHLLLALNRFHVRLYDGSWSQWGADSSLPAEPLN